MKLMKNVFFYPGAENDCNIYVFDSELMVDAGTGRFFQVVKSSMTEEFDLSLLKTIFLTHRHFDHVGGTAKFRNLSSPKVICHSSEEPFIRNGEQTYADLFSSSPKAITVDGTVRDGDVIKTKNFSFRVVHTPGHTEGSACLYEPEQKILVSGDTLFDGSIGRTDMQGGSFASIYRSIDRLGQMDIDYLLPGHGNPRLIKSTLMMRQILNALENRSQVKRNDLR